jgi:anti-anti-sigma factor
VSNFTIEQHKIDNETLQLKFVGEFQGMAVEDFEPKIMAALNACKKKLILNLKDAPYVDSQAVALFKKLADAAQASKRHLVIQAPNPGVDKVLKILHLDKVIEIVQDYNPNDYKST